MLAQRWADVVPILYKCFVFAGTDAEYINVDTSKTNVFVKNAQWHIYSVGMILTVTNIIRRWNKMFTSTAKLKNSLIFISLANYKLQ